MGRTCRFAHNSTTLLPEGDSMNLWAVTMVRDELDVLPYTLAHIASQGVTGIIVADNNSTDGTREWLNAAGVQQTLGCRLIVQHDHEVGYYQSRKMTQLAHDAMNEGAEWVLPFDADECWFSVLSGDNLADTLGDVSAGVDYVMASLHNHFATSADDAMERNPFIRIQHRDPLRAPLPKVIVRARDDIIIAQGNHAATAQNSELAGVTAPIEVGHFPWRTPEQFERKIRNGAEAYRATDLPDDMGAHWRQYGQILESGGSEGLREVYDTWFHDPDLRLEKRPVPYGYTGLT